MESLGSEVLAHVEVDAVSVRGHAWSPGSTPPCPWPAASGSRWWPTRSASTSSTRRPSGRSPLGGRRELDQQLLGGRLRRRRRPSRRPRRRARGRSPWIGPGRRSRPGRGRGRSRSSRPRGRWLARRGCGPAGRPGRGRPGRPRAPTRQRSARASPRQLGRRLASGAQVAHHVAGSTRVLRTREVHVARPRSKRSARRARSAVRARTRSLAPSASASSSARTPSSISPADRRAASARAVSRPASAAAISSSVPPSDPNTPWIERRTSRSGSGGNASALTPSATRPPPTRA